MFSKIVLPVCRAPKRAVTDDSFRQLKIWRVTLGRGMRLSLQWVFDANAADDLPLVQVFGPQRFTVGAFGGHDNQRISKKQP
jgi:hypothetical protein